MVIALTMMTTKTPIWSGNATSVSTSQPTLQLRLVWDSQATVEQTISAAPAMRQEKAATNQTGGAGAGKRDNHITAKT